MKKRMIKNKFTILITIVLPVLIYGCESAKDAFEGKKRSEQSDEFLVEKKNPLALPPDFEKLPVPGNQEVSPETFADNDEVKDLLNIQESDTSDSNDQINSSDLESTIIKKIQ
tara:strand:- start:122 stop:460 length:339 start_codon:yes stop_codon:yes gene_type:complete